MSSPVLAANVLAEAAAVQLVLTNAPAGALEITREDANGRHPVRQLPGHVTSAGSLVVTDYECALTGTVTYSVEGTRTNVLANPSAEVDATAWTPSRMTIASYLYPSEVVPAGVRVFRGTVTTTGGGALSQYVYSTALIPTTPGTPWSGGLSVRVPIAGTWRLSLQFRDAGGAVLGYASSPDTALAGSTSPTGWTVLTASGVAPANTANVRYLLFNVLDSAVGYIVEWDRAWCVADPTPGTYLEGTQPATLTATVNAPLTLQPRVAVVGRPARAMPVLAVETYSETSDSATVLVAILGGGELPIIGGLDRRQGSVGLHLATYAQARQLRQVLASGAVVQLRQVTYSGMDLYLTPQRVRIDPAPQDGNAPAEWVVTIDYLETAAPEDVDLASGAAWTVGDVAATFTSCADVLAEFATCLELAVGP